MKRRIPALLLCVALMLPWLSGCAEERDPDQSGTIQTQAPTEGVSQPDIISGTYSDALDESLILALGAGHCYARGVLTQLPRPVLTVQNVAYLPGGFAARSLGGSARQEADTAWLSLQDGELILTSGSQDAQLNGEAYTLSAPAFSDGEEILLPVRDFARAMDLDLQEQGELLILGPGLEEAVEDCGAVSLGGLYRNLACKLSAPQSAAGGEEAEWTGDILRLTIDASVLPVSSQPNELIAQVGSFFVEDVTVRETQEEGILELEMNVYNYMGYTYGSVRTYDGEGRLIKSYEVDAYEGTKAGIVSWGRGAVAVVGDTFEAIRDKDWDHLSYRSQYNSAVTHLQIEFPEDGYVVLTGNPRHDENLKSYNMARVIVAVLESLEAFEVDKSITIDKEELVKQLKDMILPVMTTEGAELWTAIQNVGEKGWEQKEGLLQLIEAVREFMEETDVLKKLKDKARESADNSMSTLCEYWLDKGLEELFPNAEVIFSLWRVSNQFANLWCLQQDLEYAPQTPTLIMEVAGWREAYRQFLLENQVRQGHASQYEKGEGQFILAYVRGKCYPDLFIVDAVGQTMMYTYEDRQVKQVLFANGWTDVFRFGLEDFYWSENQEIFITFGGKLDMYCPVEHGIYDYVLLRRLETSGDAYYVQDFDSAAMCEDGYLYMSGYEKKPTGQMLYNLYMSGYRMSREENFTLDQEERYAIVPFIIDEVLG